MSLENPPEPTALPRPNVLFRSGRDALRGLAEYGAVKYGWKRVLIPSYFCQEVVESLLTTPLQVTLYSDGPLDDFSPPASASSGDLLLVVNHFGLRQQPRYPESLHQKVTIVEDHTHDPWSAWAKQSQAPYLLMSLRKTLPIPDGALIYSPMQWPLPKEPDVTATGTATALDKLSAMLLKRLYLQGEDIPKGRFRELATRGEARFASGEISSVSSYTSALLPQLPMTAWRKQRQVNFLAFSAYFNQGLRIRVLEPSDPDGVPLSCVLLAESYEQREAIRSELIKRDIYPAVLWPLETPLLPNIPERHLDLSRRILSIACDMRYSMQDMAVAAARVKELL